MSFTAKILPFLLIIGLPVIFTDTIPEDHRSIECFYCNSVDNPECNLIASISQPLPKTMCKVNPSSGFHQEDIHCVIMAATITENNKTESHVFRNCGYKGACGLMMLYNQMPDKNMTVTTCQACFEDRCNRNFI